MNPEHEKKIDELLEALTKEIKKECRHLYNSGGIDSSKYSDEDFTLAKILISAAIETCKHRFRPLNDENRKARDNLLHF